MNHTDSITLRTTLKPSDADAVHRLVAATGMFRPDEIDIADELIAESLQKGAAASYCFTLAESDGNVIGYACHGPTPCTVSTWDLYWIAVHPDAQGRGIGRLLLKHVEKQIAGAGGTRIYVDTSGRDAYTPTRAFYERTGYEKAATLPHFYAPNDAKVIYLKTLICP